MSTYEGLFIFPKNLNEDDVEAVTTEVRKDIERAEGKIQSVTRLGKRSFARPMKKQDAGYYTVVVFELPGEQLADLRARLQLNERILRMQIVRATEGGPKEE